jgi:hypothetical protein
MTMFPQLSDNYYVDNDHDILKLMDYTYAKNITTNQSFWNEAEIDSRFKAGDQTLYNDMYGGGVPAFRKRQFCFNRIRRVINMISGFQRQHRKATSVAPVHPRDDQTADQFSKILSHVNNYGHVLETISEAFEGALTTGMNLLSTWMDYRRDPVNGDIKVDNVSYNGYLIDPFFKNMDLSDCNNIWTRKFLSRTQVESLLPSRADEIKTMRGWGNRDGKFQFMPESYNYGMQDLIMYDEFWYLDTRKQKLLVDIDSGETSEWVGQDEDIYAFLARYPQIIEMNQMVPTVKLAIVVQGKVMYHGPNPLGIDRYPFIPVWAYYEPQIPYFPWRVQGVVRGLRDSQYLYNRSRITMLDVQESQINSGWVYKENALVNPKDVFMTGQGKGLALKAEAQITDVQRIDPPQIPPSMIQLSEFLGNEISQVSGVNEELLGSADDDKAGILSMMRQGAGLTTLQCLFDNLDRAQKMLGDVHVEMIQANWTPGKIARILDEEPSEQFYNRAFGKYDSVVEEASLTSTQRQQAFKTAVYLREIGIPIPTEFLIKNMNIPDKQELVEQIQAIEQAQNQQQQKREAMELSQMQIDNETKLAYADSQKALAQERINKTRLDAAVSAERLQRADSDRTGAILNLVRAAKEIQGMNLEHLERAVALAQTIGTDDEQTEELRGQVNDVAQNVQTPHTTVSQGQGQMGQMGQDQGIQGLVGSQLNQGL